MLNLISKHPRYLTHLKFHWGILHTPRFLPFTHGKLWALDNDCFNDYAPDKIMKSLDASLLTHCKPLFCVVPDVVGNHDATMERYHQWRDEYTSRNLAMALAIQNGATVQTIPFDDIGAVFIAGDDAFKYSSTIRDVVGEAQLRGLWVHMGRVNTVRRVKYAGAIGVHSIDGTGWARFTDDKNATVGKHLEYRQGLLF